MASSNYKFETVIFSSDLEFFFQNDGVTKTGYKRLMLKIQENNEEKFFQKKRVRQCLLKNFVNTLFSKNKIL